MIDLHLHTTASDGLLAPAELVRRAHSAGIRAMSVTDHDTVAGLDEAQAAAGALGIEFVSGIEVTAVHEERDVHILGYYVDPGAPVLGPFLERQRELRVERLREIAARLDRLGAHVDVDVLLGEAALMPGRAVGRPAMAAALVAAGHVSTHQEAFDRYLAHGCAAFVPRTGATPADVLEVIHQAGGLASMAHPGVTKTPALLTALIGRGLDAIEVFHPDHSPDQREAWHALARQADLLITGGSDFHGDDRERVLAAATLPAAEFERLAAAARSRPAAR